MKILLIQTAFLGDAVLTLPLLEKLSEKFPGSEIDVVSLPSTKEVFSLSPTVSNIIPFDKKGKEKSFTATLAFAFRLRKSNYDFVVSPHRSARSAIIAFLTGAPVRISFDTASLSFLYTEKDVYRKDYHEVKRNLSLISSGKELEQWKRIPRVVIPDTDRETVASILNNNSLKRLALIAPGSVWETKKYPAEYFREIAKYFIDKGFFVGLIGGKEDAELCREISDPGSVKILNFCGKFTIPQSVELMKKAEILITNDSAPTHLGVIAGTKVLTIYTSTVPEFGFYPYNEGSSYVSLDMDCKPCGIHGKTKCPLGHFNCGNNLKPETVIKKAEEMILKI